MFDTITSVFVPPHVIQPDRQHERAVAEIGGLDVSNPRDLARLLDATTSPDAAIRCLAAAKLEVADPLLVAKPWTHSLEDSSRAVRRAAIRAAAHVARPDLRLLFERALADKDACVRYYALRGLAQIGVGRADQSVERRKLDDDLRVRFAAEAALDGQPAAVAVTPVCQGVRMQTIDTFHLVSTTFEACADFGATADGSPVCAECGWLEGEHQTPDAEVHTLPARRKAVRAPKRLAS